MNLYQNLNKRVKTFFYLGLALGATQLNCCQEETTKTLSPEKETQVETISHYSFSNFGQVKLNRLGGDGDYTAITEGDFDGDGDLDIAVLDNLHNRLVILENNIPQKTPKISLEGIVEPGR